MTARDLSPDCHTAGFRGIQRELLQNFGIDLPAEELAVLTRRSVTLSLRKGVHSVLCAHVKCTQQSCSRNFGIDLPAEELAVITRRYVFFCMTLKPRVE